MRAGRRTGRLPLALAAILLSAWAAAVTPAGAITNGAPDGEHPYVGLLVTVGADGEREPVCSGTLIAPTVFLTAAHCTYSLEAQGLAAFVSFAPVFAPASPLIGGRAVTHPDFDPLLPFQDPDTHDIAIVLLDRPVTDLGFAELPAAGLLDALAGARGGRQSFTVVGYGAAGLLPGGGPPRYDVPTVRLAATTSLVTLRSALTDGVNLQMTSSPGGGQGGICFGDSGGPVLLPHSHTLVGLSSFLLNFTCTGGAFAFRLDTEAALAFLAPYLSH